MYSDEMSSENQACIGLAFICYLLRLATVPRQGTFKREQGPANTGALAAPATVCGERAFNNGHWETGKAGRSATTRKPGDLLSQALPDRHPG